MFQRLRTFLEKRKVIRAVDSFDEEGLITAAEKGDLRSLGILIEAGFSVNSLNDRGVPAISRAIEKNHLPVIRMLIDAGANVNLKDSNGITPLMVAIEEGNRHIFAYLMEQSPELELTDQLHETALIKAAHAGNTTLARKLIEAGAEIDVTNLQGQTPLMIAAENQRTGIVKALLEAGANPNIRDNQDNSVFDRNHLSPRITKMLKQASNHHKRAEKGESPNDIYSVIPMSLFNQFPAISSLMLGFADVLYTQLNAKDLMDQWEDKGKGLIEKVDLNQVSGNVASIAALLENQLTSASNETKASPVPSPLNGQHQQQLDQALIDAVKVNACKAAHVLLALGADVNARTPEGDTPLHLAITSGEMVKILLDGGAAKGLRNRDALTPKELASQQNQTEVAELLS